MEKEFVAVDRFLLATETIRMVSDSLFDLSEKGINIDRGRIATIAYVLYNVLEVLNEFEEDLTNDRVMIFNK